MPAGLATALASALLALAAPAGGATASLIGASRADAAVDTFSATGSMAPPGRAIAASGLLPDGKAIVAGGISWTLGGNPTALDSAELYDPATGSWSATGSLSGPRFFSAFATLSNGKLLLAGGAASWFSATPYSSAELYDPSTGSFSTTGSMGAGRVGAGAAVLGDGRVLVAGGKDASSAQLDSAELYDPQAGTFSPTGSMTAPGGGEGYSVNLVTLADGKVLAMGLGSSDADTSLYNPATGTWSASGSMATGRFSGAYARLANGKVLAAGGIQPGIGGGPLASAELYDPATGQFTATGSMSTPRYEPVYTALPDGRVLVAGGGDISGYFSSAETYDPASGTFSPVGSMTESRDFAPSVVLKDGRVLVAGGVRETTGFLTTPSADIFTPPLAAASLSPSSLDFGDRRAGSGASAAKTVTLSSSGDLPVVIGAGGPSVSGADPGQFQVKGGTCTAGGSVAVGSSCTIEVAFNPTSTGAKAASLSVPTNAGTRTAALSGAGVPPTPPSIRIGSTSVRGSSVITRVRVSGPGRIRQRGTYRTTGSSAAAIRTACTASRTASKAGTYTLTCRLNSAARKARRKGALRVRVLTTFTPTGGTPRSVARTAVFRSLKPNYTG